MKPIFFGIGVTAALGGLAVLLIGPRLDFLSPWWGTILRAYGFTLGLHAAAALVTSIVVFYALARVVGLADLGRRVDLVERGIRRGSGDRALQHALERSDQGRVTPINNNTTTPFIGRATMTLTDKQQRVAPRRVGRSGLAIGLRSRYGRRGRAPGSRLSPCLQNAFTGPIARGLALISIVCGGLMFAFGEGGSKKAMAGIIFGVGMAVGAVNFMGWLFP